MNAPCLMQPTSEAKTHWRCVNCGRAIKLPRSVPAVFWPGCPANADVPPLYRRAWSFLKAWTLHIVAGRPATPAHLRDLRLKICQGCEHYDGTLCRKCGCGIKSREAWMTDKLSMAGQSCPVGKWGPVVLPAPSGKRS